MIEPKKGILIAFGELFLKSPGVKKLFDKRLVNNLRFSLEKAGVDFKIRHFRDRVFIETKAGGKALKIAKEIFGISWLAQTLFFESASLKDISAFTDSNYQKWIKPGQTFALRARAEKQKGLEKRGKIIESIADVIRRKVDLTRPNKELFIERRKMGWLIYFKKVQGAGGLPLGCEGKALCLMSGGIDSPAAAYLIARRGAENVWLHFHSFPLVSKTSIEKVKDLARVFLTYQPRLKIYSVPFSEAQKKIKTKIPAKYRILLYRRLMFKIGQTIAKKEKCQALVTGECLGQVSSQTLSNMEVIEEAVKIPVFRPLIGMDKQEIITLAKKIDTYEISIRPHEDCCTLFVPKHPTGQGRIEKVKEFEKDLDIRSIIKSTLAEIEIINY